jgi:hypothetical protein
MKQTLIIIALVGLGYVTYGQTISIGQDTITWEIDELNDLARDTTEVFHCKFITTPTGIKWLQKNDGFINNFSVVSTSGSWGNLSLNGSYTFNVSFHEQTGKLSFERVDGLMHITMSFLEAGSNKMPYSFRVSNYTKN